MTAFCQRIFAWFAGEEGQDLIEYALLAFLVAAALVSALRLVAPPLIALFSRVVDAFP